MVAFRLDGSEQVEVMIRCGDLLRAGPIALDFCIEHGVKTGGCDAVREAVERRAFALEQEIAAEQLEYWDAWVEGEGRASEGITKEAALAAQRSALERYKRIAHARKLLLDATRSELQWIREEGVREHLRAKKVNAGLTVAAIEEVPDLVGMNIETNFTSYAEHVEVRSLLSLSLFLLFVGDTPLKTTFSASQKIQSLAKHLAIPGRGLDIEIPRVPYDQVDEELVSLHAAVGIPMVVTGWENFPKWTLKEILEVCGGDTKVTLKRAATKEIEVSSVAWAHLVNGDKISMKEYIDGIMRAEASDEQHEQEWTDLYLHDFSMPRDCPGLLNSFRVPWFLARDQLQRLRFEEASQDGRVDGDSGGIAGGTDDEDGDIAADRARRVLSFHEPVENASLDDEIVASPRPGTQASAAALDKMFGEYRDYWPSLFIGPPKTGSGLHADWADSAGWMGMVRGSKLWALGVEADSE